MTNEEARSILIKTKVMCVSGKVTEWEKAQKLAYDSIQENTKLKAEINELTLENVCANHVIDKLKAEIEQLKTELEQSVKLPCKLKDTVYEVVKCDDGVTRIFEMKICNVCEYGSFHNGSKKKFVWNIYMEDEKGFGYSYGTFYDFGKTIFLSLKEAEQSLKRQVEE